VIGSVTASEDLERVLAQWVLLGIPGDPSTEKTDAACMSLSLDEVHTGVVWKSRDRVRSSICAGKTSGPDRFSARVRFLAALVKHDGKWEVVATQSTPIKLAKPNKI
jgi:hypothetical protein